jgi:hypothetical protein
MDALLKASFMIGASLIFLIVFNLLKPSGNFTYHQVQHSRILHGAHFAFMCFVGISEQTATFAL